MKLQQALLLGALLAAGRGALADQPGLGIGDPAPPLKSGAWVQGVPVSHFEKGTVYIVEFWATWCGPCRASIPHLNEVWKKYEDRGLVVVGQNMWEPNDAKVAPFVKSMGVQMTYRVALDDKGTNDPQHGAMALSWMEAAGQHGIPTAFVVDQQGRIAWIGHPMNLDDTLIEAVLDGKNDIGKAAADFREQTMRNAEGQARSKRYFDAVNKKDWSTALARLVEILALNPADKTDPKVVILGKMLEAKDDGAAAKFADQNHFASLKLLPVGEAGTLRSKVGETQSTIVINNRTGHSLHEMWITYQGGRQDYGTIPPHSVSIRVTWDTHPWLLIDEQKNAAALYVAQAGNCLADIPAKAP